MLLCQDRQGYLNLCELLSRAYQEGQHHGMPYVRQDWVAEYAEGLIALSAGREGDIGQAILTDHPNRAQATGRDWAGLFPDRFYIELQRTGRDQEQQYETVALNIAASLGLPVVASNDVRFLDKADFRAHEARVCIHDGRLLVRQAPRTPLLGRAVLQEPGRNGGTVRDLPEALENTVQLAMRCNLEMEFGTYYLPDFPPRTA